MPLTDDQIATLVKGFAVLARDLRATYNAIGEAGRHHPVVISIGAFGRLATAEKFLHEVGEAVDAANKQLPGTLPPETPIIFYSGHGAVRATTWGEFCDANKDDPGELAGVASALTAQGQAIMGGGAQPVVHVRLVEHDGGTDG